MEDKLNATLKACVEVQCKVLDRVFDNIRPTDGLSLADLALAAPKGRAPETPKTMVTRGLL